MLKFAKLLLVATLSVVCATAAPLVPLEFAGDAATSSHPGAIMASLKMSSLNNILQLLAPLLPNKMLLGKSFPVDVHKSITNSIDFNLNNVTISSVSGSFDHSLSWKENTDTPTAFLDISGFDINGTLDGNVTGLPKALNF